MSCVWKSSGVRLRRRHLATPRLARSHLVRHRLAVHRLVVQPHVAEERPPQALVVGGLEVARSGVDVPAVEREVLPCGREREESGISRAGEVLAVRLTGDVRGNDGRGPGVGEVRDGGNMRVDVEAVVLHAVVPVVVNADIIAAVYNLSPPLRTRLQEATRKRQRRAKR